MQDASVNKVHRWQQQHVEYCNLVTTSQNMHKICNSWQITGLEYKKLCTTFHQRTSTRLGVLLLYSPIFEQGSHWLLDHWVWVPYQYSQFGLLDSHFNVYIIGLDSDIFFSVCNQTNHTFCNQVRTLLKRLSNLLLNTAIYKWNM